MTIENLMVEIERARREKDALGKYFHARDRIDLIKIHFKKTRDFVDNHGCSCADDSFSLQYADNCDIFSRLRDVFEEYLCREYKKASDDLERLEQKKTELEKVLNS